MTDASDPRIELRRLYAHAIRQMLYCHAVCEQRPSANWKRLEHQYLTDALDVMKLIGSWDRIGDDADDGNPVLAQYAAALSVRRELPDGWES